MICDGRPNCVHAQVFALDNKDWMCRIHEGVAGMVRHCAACRGGFARYRMPQVQAVWGPDGRHILVTADFQLHVTIWSLVSQVGQFSCTFVKSS